MAPVKALWQESRWHVVGTERGLGKGDSVGKGSMEDWEVRNVKGPDYITSLGCGRDLGFSWSKMGCWLKIYGLGGRQTDMFERHQSIWLQN